jgi:hypothetical protein
MLRVLIDTSVWLDLAQNPKLTPLLLVVENMVAEGLLSLIVPRVVFDEFRKNRERVSKSSARSLASHFGQVKEAVRKSGTDAKRKNKLLKELDDLNHKIPLIGGTADAVLQRVDKLLSRTTITEATDAVKLAAAERALQRKAPCHHENKNSLADAIVLEAYLEAVKQGEARQRFALVTHNTSDFSAPGGNQKLPHPDLALHFSKIKSMFFVALGDLLKRVQPALMTALVWEQSWEQEPRGLSEILAAHEVLLKQVWYNRHHNWLWRLEKGKEFIVSRDEWELNKDKRGYAAKHTPEDIFKGARKAAKRVERELGPESSGPWSDFEWGMINGKLSALRWVLGDEWDMLDT